jgi:hypothetical protein
VGTASERAARYPELRSTRLALFAVSIVLVLDLPSSGARKRRVEDESEDDDEDD